MTIPDYTYSSPDPLYFFEWTGNSPFSIEEFYSRLSSSGLMGRNPSTMNKRAFMQLFSGNIIPSRPEGYEYEMRKGVKEIEQHPMPEKLEHRKRRVPGIYQGGNLKVNWSAGPTLLVDLFIVLIDKGYVKCKNKPHRVIHESFVFTNKRKPSAEQFGRYFKDIIDISEKHSELIKQLLPE